MNTQTLIGGARMHPSLSHSRSPHRAFSSPLCAFPCTRRNAGVSPCAAPAHKSSSVLTSSSGTVSVPGRTHVVSFKTGVEQEQATLCENHLTASHFNEHRLLSTHPTMKALIFFITCLALTISARISAAADSPDLILHNGKIAAVDEAFSIHRAIAIRDGRILRLGSDNEILPLRTEETEIINLRGKL